MLRKKSFFSFIVLPLIIFSLVGCTQDNTINAKEVIEKENIQEWDLLWISDSSGWGVTDVYADYVAEDLGIDIKVNDQSISGAAVGEVLAALKGEPTPSFNLANMDEYIKDAEIIVFYGNPTYSIVPDNPWDWNCGQGVEACYVTNCEMDTFDLYIEHIKEVYSIIHKLREGQPTIIRAYDAYNPRLKSQCSVDGVFDECVQCWENYNNAIHLAAEEMGVPVANVFDAWNGVDHTENPVEKGFVRSDGEHPNEKGAQVIASLLRSLGYEMIIP